MNKIRLIVLVVYDSKIKDILLYPPASDKYITFKQRLLEEQMTAFEAQLKKLLQVIDKENNIFPLFLSHSIVWVSQRSLDNIPTKNGFDDRLYNDCQMSLNKTIRVCNLTNGYDSKFKQATSPMRTNELRLELYSCLIWRLKAQFVRIKSFSPFLGYLHSGSIAVACGYTRAAALHNNQSISAKYERRS